MALPNAARDLDEQAPRPSLAIVGASARVVMLRHGGEVMLDRELDARGGSVAVPLGAERIAVAVGTPADQQRPGLSGWHAGSALPMLGHGSALAAQAVLHVEGRVRSVRQRGLQREAGWLRAADLVEGTALVSTRFAAPVHARRDRARRPDRDERRPRALARARRRGARDRRRRRAGARRRSSCAASARCSSIRSSPQATGGVTVSVASEDGWHLVGVMAAPDGSDVEALASQLASTSLDLLVRGPVAPGTAQATLHWQPATKRGRAIEEAIDLGTPRSVRRAAPAARAPAAPRRRSRKTPE